MDSSEGSHSNNAVTDISHVLESLGSLIGELDNLEVDKSDAVDSNDNHAVDHDLSVEDLLADTDEFDDDNDDQRLLIPCKTSPAQKAPSGFLSHGSHHNSHLNSNSVAQGHKGSACGPVYDIPTSGAISKAFSTTQLVSQESHTSASLSRQEHGDHYSVPSGSRSKGHSSSQPGPLYLHNSASFSAQGHDNCYSVPSGSRPKGRSSSQSDPLHLHNSTSLQKHIHDTNSHYTVPPRRGGHKEAVKEVALSGEVHGSFKKLDEGSSTSATQKYVHLPASHPKAEPNHYVTTSEVGVPRPRQVNEKSEASGNSMVHCSQKMKRERNSAQEVPVNVFNEDNKPIGLLVSSSMKAREACYQLTLLNKVDDVPQWVLVEHLTDLGLERNLEDHENLMAIVNTWAPGSNNKLLFRKVAKKYHFFAHTSNYFPPHLLDSEHSDKAVTEKAQRAKTILHQKLFSTCTRVPEIEGILHCKDFGKKSWSKKFLFLRGSGIYSSNKGKSKASKDLECYVQFDGANLYNILYPKKSHKTPTEYCFCVVPFRARELKDLKCFCVDDEKTLMSWKMAVRIAKFGPQLRQNYDDMLRKFAKLTKYHDQQTSESNRQNMVSEREDRNGNTCIKEGQVAMDFTGERGRVITDSKEIQELANTRNKAKFSHRISSVHFIPTDTAIPGQHFMSEPWYHGRITREQSLALLIAAGAQDGLFLVRESSSVAGVFVLTFCMNRRVYHCQLVQDIGEGSQYFFSLGKGPAFKTLHELIHFYQQKPLNGVSLALRTPCPKSACKP